MKNRYKLLGGIVIIVAAIILAYSKIVIKVEKTKYNAINNQYLNSSEQKSKNSEYSKLYRKYLELSDEEKAKIKAIPRMYDVPMDVLYENNETSKKSLWDRFLSLFKSSETDELPESYILLQDEDIGIECEEYGGIDIQIEDQGQDGLCWCFTSLTTLETYLSLRGIDYDFSERHLDYLTSEEFGGDRILRSGGWFENFCQYTTNNYGPVLEESVPYYENYDVEQYEYLLGLEPVVYVNETVDFPTIFKDGSVSYTEEDLELFRNRVKEHIMENGGLYASICSSEEGSGGLFSNNSTIKDYNGNWVLNYSGSHVSNHAITIIGWDDAFSKDNFPEENRPNFDGAYIALNSWGDSWGDNGIFYISYEDIYVESNMYGIINVTTDKPKYDETIEFEDENLYNCIKEMLGNKNTQFDDNNRKIYTKKFFIDNIRELDISNKGIENLKGLEFFNNLQKLNLSNNNISDISYLTNQTNLETLDLSNNNISDISLLPNAPYTKLILSNNPIEVFPEFSMSIAEIYFDNCNFDDDDILKIYKVFPSYLLLSLKNNNITDLSCMKYDYYERNKIDLSGNENIKLETITTVGELVVNHCNISNAEKIAENFLGYSLDLSYNPIQDVSVLQNCNLYALNISYTEVKDVSCLTNIIDLNVSGNENLNGLEGLTTLSSLEINDCKLDDNKLINIIQNFINLRVLSINNNHITNIDFINNYPLLETLYANNNQLGRINSINNTSIENLYLTNNNISDISGLSNFYYIKNLNLSNNNISDLTPLSNLGSADNIDLSNNIISDISAITSIRVGYNMILSNNKIENVEILKDLFGVIVENQEIVLELDIEKDKLNEIEVPSLINTAFKRGMYKENVQIICENCTINSTATKIKLTSNNFNEGQAKIIIKGGIFDGTTYTINYNTVEKISVTNIKVKSEATKKHYIENENFDTTGLVVEVTYENGLVEKTTDYTIVNGEKLSAGQENIIIRSNKNPEIEITYPIKVYGENEIEIMQFPDDNLYKIIKDKSIFEDFSREIIIIKYDDEKNTVIMPKKNIEKITMIWGYAKNITDISGIEKFINLESVNFSHNTNLASIEPLIHLNNLKSVELYNTNVNDISGLLIKENVIKIGLRKQVQEIFKANTQQIELPQFIYQSLIFQENIIEDFGESLTEPITAQAYIYYNVGMYEDGYYYIDYEGDKKEVEVIIDKERQIAKIELDTEITEEHMVGLRGIEVVINGGKTTGAMYTTFYEISEENTEQLKVNINTYEEQQDETGKYITKIEPETEIKDVIKNIQTNGTIEIYKGTEKITNTATNIGTGMILRITFNNQKVEYTVIVKGDINGDGRAKLSDLSKLKLAIIGSTQLNGAYERAADINGDGNVKLSDLSKIKLYLVGKESL